MHHIDYNRFAYYIYYMFILYLFIYNTYIMNRPTDNKQLQCDVVVKVQGERLIFVGCDKSGHFQVWMFV